MWLRKQEPGEVTTDPSGAELSYTRTGLRVMQWEGNVAEEAGTGRGNNRS